MALSQPNPQDPQDPLSAGSFKKQSRQILVALFFPTIAILFNSSVFGIALPTIRDEFMIGADVTAWLFIAYSLPFMIFMPLFGRLGDELGKARLLAMGAIVMLLGTLVILLANGLAWIFIGRMIQGIGSSGVTPLSLSIIAQRFGPEERGRALGTWNATAPGTSIFAPSIGGFLIDNFGWRSTLLPVLVICLVAFLIVSWRIPPRKGKVNLGVLRDFDWFGVLLLSASVMFLVFFVSSRPITGVEPLRDWRLLIGFAIFTSIFTWWENRRREPLIDLKLLRQRRFLLGSLIAAFRMAMMVGINFLLPLYLADLYQLNASRIGFVATVHSITLFIAIRWGGRLADERPHRRIILMGLAIQAVAMGYLALLPISFPLFWIFLGVSLHGLGAGIFMASVHRTTLDLIPDEHSGAAAGVYSMTRFGGSMLATALVGVILQTTQNSGFALSVTYQFAYGFMVLIGIGGLLSAFALKREGSA